MIGTLRFVGLLNAAVWFGAAVLYSLAIGPATRSTTMQELLGARNFPFFSEAIASVLVSRYFYFQLVCAIIAILHLLAEWIYFGKSPRRFWGWLLAGLFMYVLIQGQFLQPKLKQWHAARYAANFPIERRQAAGQSHDRWHKGSQLLNFLAVCGLGVHLWRVANPVDAARFVSTTKFRG